MCRAKLILTQDSTLHLHKFHLLPLIIPFIFSLFPSSVNFWSRPLTVRTSLSNRYSSHPCLAPCLLIRRVSWRIFLIYSNKTSLNKKSSHSAPSSAFPWHSIYDWTIIKSDQSIFRPDRKFWHFFFPTWQTTNHIISFPAHWNRIPPKNVHSLTWDRHLILKN